MKNRILLLIAHKENRRLLQEAFQQHYEVINVENDADLLQPFDLGLVDGPALDQHWRKLKERKELELPVFLPLLLITTRRDIGMCTRHLWQSIDEFIISPIEKTELVARVEILLRTRKLSLQLKASNIELQNETLARQQALEEQEKLQKLKDLFVSVASHELKTPITTIKGFAQLLTRSLNSPKAESRSPEKLLQMLETIIKQSNRMSKLIQDLLDFSRIQSRQLELNYSQINLVALLHKVIEQQKITNSDHILELEVTQETVLISLDEARIEQVLINLLGNAAKYSKPGTTIRVGLEVARLKNEAENITAIPGYTQAPLEVTVWVRDQGVGISPENQNQLFDQFYRVPNPNQLQVEGLGLGLYIVNQIIKQHGGKIWLESEVGEGSTFYFTLPCVGRPEL